MNKRECLAVQNNNSFTLLYPLRGIYNSCFRLQPIPQPVITHRSRTGALLPVPVTRVGPGHFCRYRLPEMDRDAFAGTGYQRWCTSGFISSSYIAVIALFCSSVRSERMHSNAVGLSICQIDSSHHFFFFTGMIKILFRFLATLVIRGAYFEDISTITSLMAVT